jgi:hypothetical protein
MNLASDQLLFLAIAAYAPPQLRCEYAGRYGSTPSMQAMVAIDLIKYEPSTTSLWATISATEKGHTLLEAACCLPMPVPTSGWKMPC